MPPPALALSREDEAALESLEPKLELIRSRVGGVAQHYHTGFYLWGEGGTSKSYTVLEELKARRADFILHNSQMTGRGLVDELQRLPTSIHVLEDCESMLDDRRAWGVLRSALWSQSRKRPPEREISWTAFKTPIRFIFTGGVILIANRSLDNIPELRALGTRMAVLQFVATFAEVAALMRKVALQGYDFGLDYVSPRECWEVAEFVIGRLRGLGRPLDMRVYVNGVRDYLQDKCGHSKVGWQDLIETRLRQATVFRERRADVVARERQIALEISQTNVPPAERLRLWRERTRSPRHPEGKSERAYWRRLAEVTGVPVPAAGRRPVSGEEAGAAEGP
jgi:hypothetical protein